MADLQGGAYGPRPPTSAQLAQQQIPFEQRLETAYFAGRKPSQDELTGFRNFLASEQGSGFSNSRIEADFQKLKDNNFDFAGLLDSSYYQNKLANQIADQRTTLKTGDLYKGDITAMGGIDSATQYMAGLLVRSGIRDLSEIQEKKEIVPQYGVDPNAKYNYDAVDRFNNQFANTGYFPERGERVEINGKPYFVDYTYNSSGEYGETYGYLLPGVKTGETIKTSLINSRTGEQLKQGHDASYIYAATQNSSDTGQPDSDYTIGGSFAGGNTSLRVKMVNGTPVFYSTAGPSSATFSPEQISMAVGVASLMFPGVGQAIGSAIAGTVGVAVSPAVAGAIGSFVINTAASEGDVTKGLISAATSLAGAQLFSGQDAAIAAGDLQGAAAAGLLPEDVSDFLSTIESAAPASGDLTGGLTADQLQAAVDIPAIGDALNNISDQLPGLANANVDNALASSELLPGDFQAGPGSIENILAGRGLMPDMYFDGAFGPPSFEPPSGEMGQLSFDRPASFEGARASTMENFLSERGLVPEMQPDGTVRLASVQPPGGEIGRLSLDQPVSFEGGRAPVEGPEFLGPNISSSPNVVATLDDGTLLIADPAGNLSAVDPAAVSLDTGLDVSDALDAKLVDEATASSLDPNAPVSPDGSISQTLSDGSGIEIDPAGNVTSVDAGNQDAALDAGTDAGTDAAVKINRDVTLDTEPIDGTAKPGGPIDADGVLIDRNVTLDATPPDSASQSSNVIDAGSNASTAPAESTVVQTFDDGSTIVMDGNGNLSATPALSENTGVVVDAGGATQTIPSDTTLQDTATVQTLDDGSTLKVDATGNVTATDAGTALDAETSLSTDATSTNTALQDTAQTQGTVQTFDDGSKLQTFDDGSTIATDADGNVVTSTATDVSPFQIGTPNTSLTEKIIDYVTSNPLTTAALLAGATGLAGGEEQQQQTTPKKTYTYQPAPTLAPQEGLKQLFRASESIYGPPVTYTPPKPEVFTAPEVRTGPLLSGRAPGSGLPSLIKTLPTPQTIDINKLTPEQLAAIQQMVSQGA